MQKGHNTAIIDREKGNSILVHADQIRPQGDCEEQNEEEISTIPSVNDLWEQPLHNETSEDEIMHDQVGQWLWKLGWRSNNTRRRPWLHLSAEQI